MNEVKEYLKLIEDMHKKEVNGEGHYVTSDDIEWMIRTIKALQVEIETTTFSKDVYKNCFEKMVEQ